MGGGALRPFRRSSSQAYEEEEQDEFLRRSTRADVVLAQASRPDWALPDYLVFQDHKENDHNEDVQGDTWHRVSLACHLDESPRHATNMPKAATSHHDNKKDKDKEIEEPSKGGRFYSKNHSSVGTWRMMGNVLSLVWGHTARNDTVIAVKTPRRWTNAVTRLQLNILDPAVNPEWFMPSILANKFKAETVAMRQFECPVCFFELHQFNAGVIRMHSRRVCGHYFHKQCAHYLMRLNKGTKQMATCPICGVEFSEVKAMPDIAHDPREWFAACDIDFGGELEEQEVIEALGAILPVNRHKLSKSVRAHWHEWDPDGDGTITLQEFVAPERGLRDWILKHLHQFRVDLQPLPSAVPSLDRNPREWFHYWDRDANGSLDKEEVVRALIRTFCRNENGRPVLQNAHDMRECAASLWEGLGYRPFDIIGFEEFVRPYGLMDQFLHNQTHCAFFGEDCENFL
mmetsp:Transcript_30151/g.54818  ORF Transcript_30151/g.54818 Transcript_30151/m.54818 type:complete len:457 (-) Transcript_30151:131-1501(-)